MIWKHPSFIVYNIVMLSHSLPILCIPNPNDVNYFPNYFLLFPALHFVFQFSVFPFLMSSISCILPLPIPFTPFIFPSNAWCSVLRIYPNQLVFLLIIVSNMFLFLPTLPSTSSFVILSIHLIFSILPQNPSRNSPDSSSWPFAESTSPAFQQFLSQI
uniref:Putative nadh dehydrogenase subunit 6 mitochondrion n=1 Tax=Xenopsylla cheopis TaxID=163159 RepID=A0A6M2E0J1_XENCH